MKINKFILILTLTIAFMLVQDPACFAQCPMCKIAAESNLENGGTMGRGLNTGILYMLAMPYALVFTIGVIWYRNRKRSASEE